MALPATREQLREWCLRKLGAPVIKINVSYDQQADRIDEALERFREHHFDGVERFYLKRQITASSMTFTGPLGYTLLKGMEFTGGTSGAKGVVYTQAANNLSIQFVTTFGVFQVGEVITSSLGTATIATGGITLGDKDNGWIPCDDSIIAVIMMVPTGGLFGQGLFSFTFQQAIQALPNFPSGDLSYFFMQKQHLALIEEMFVGDKIIRFNRMQNRINIDLNWKSGIAVGDYMIIDCYKALDPETWKKIYANYFVREYTTSLIKKQWGMNLTKFNNIQMPGGVTLNGEQIYSQAETELEKLEDKLRNEFQLPPQFYVG